MTGTRQFPVSVRLGHRETRDSYARRVLTANHEPIPTSVRPPLIDQVLERTGRAADDFTRHSSLSHADGTTCPQCTDLVTERHRCLLCAHGADITQTPHLEDLVCERHARWIGLGDVTQQRPVGTEHVTAHRLYRTLLRQHRIDVRIYRLVSSTLTDPGTESDMFPTTVAIVHALTDATFLRRLLDRRITYQAAFTLLTAQLTPLTSRANEVIAAIWHYLRPTFARLHRAQLTGTDIEPGWAHAFPFDPTHLATLGDGVPEPFHRFLQVTGSSPTEVNHWLRDLSLLPPHPSGTLKHHLGLCAAGHDMVVNTNSNQPRCPTCTTRFVRPGENDIASKAPGLVAEFDVARNGGLHPEAFPAGSNLKLWWICPTAGHSYDATPTNRVANRQDCPICLNRRVIVGVNDLATTHPELVATAWDPTNLQPPTNYSATTTRQAKFICSRGHQYWAKLIDQTSGKGCPTCAVDNLRENKQSLIDTHPQLVRHWYWFRNGKKRPEQFTADSREEVWWLCPNGHEYKQAIVRRTRRKYECGHCAKLALDPGYTPPPVTDDGIISEWHTYNNDYQPSELESFPTCFWWQCSTHRHTRQQTVVSRRQSHGCPDCDPKDRILNVLN